MSTPHIHVHVIPLHIFVDLKIIAGLLPFIQAISTVDDDDRETVYADSPPSTPRASFSSVHQRPSSSSSVVIQFALVRVELVCPPPPPLSSSASARSGACVLDVHNICVISGANPPPAHAHFTEPRDAGLPKLAEIEMGRVLVAFGRIPSEFDGRRKDIVVLLISRAGLKASTFLTIGSLSSPEQLFGTGFSDPPLNPKIIIRSTSVECTLPTIQISLDKSTIDGLQLFADDIVQWAERALSEPKKEGGSGRTTLIGSRFFVKGSSSVSAASSIRTKRGSVGSEFAFSLHVAQGE
jgi:autophagy-related protein 2